MWIHYLDLKKPGKNEARRAGVQASVRTERAERDGRNGHLTYQWPCVPLRHHRWDEYRDV